jgi:DNA-binding SARP family transcriptional activator
LGQVEALEELAGLATRRGEAALSARWLGAAEAQRDRMQAPPRATDRARLTHIQNQTRAALGDNAYAAELAAGHALSLAEVGASRKPEHAPQQAEAAPPEPALRVEALGAARVWVGAAPVPDNAWTYAKARELVFYLLARGAATKEQLSLDLWPEASPAQLRSALHRTLYHARQALGGAKWIAYDGEHYRLQLEPAGWYDVHAFEAHLAEAGRQGAEAATNRAAGAVALEHLSVAVALYQGDYLANLPTGDWALEPREHLRRRHLEARLSLGQLYFREGHYAEAATVHRQTVALDPYLETAHRELLRCYARLGETSQAVRHYQALHEQLQHELGAAPAPETALLYERLRRGDDV